MKKQNKAGTSKDPEYSAQINTNNFLNADGTVKDEWKDYTVEFDYNDSLSVTNVAADSTPSRTLEVCFYYTKTPTRSLRENALYRNNDANVFVPTSLAVSTYNTSNTINYIQAGATYNSNQDYKKVTGTISKGNLSDVAGKTVTYSASVWGNKIYTSITDKTNNAAAPFYIATAETEGNYYNEKGGFAVRATATYKKDSAANNEDHLTYMDNVCAYKLIATDSDKFAVDYTVAKDATAKTVTVTLGTAKNAANYTPIVAVYGDNGILMGVCYGTSSENALTVTGIENVNDIREIKVMFWSNDDNCQPLTAAEIKQPVTSISTGNTTGDETQTDSSTGESD